MSALLKRDDGRYDLDDNGLTPMQNAFVREYVRNVPDNATEAARRAGYKESRADKSAWELTNSPKVQAAMRREQELLHAESAPIAFHTMLKLLAPESNDSVRFQAAKDILDRCGYKPVEKIQIDHALTPTERTARIAELSQALGLEVQTVISNMQPKPIEGEVLRCDTPSAESSGNNCLDVTNNQ